MTGLSCAPTAGMDTKLFSLHRRSINRRCQGRSTCCGSEKKFRNVQIRYARCMKLAYLYRGPIGVSSSRTPSLSFSIHIDLAHLEKTANSRLAFEVGNYCTRDGIRFERCAERGKVGEALLLGDNHHLGLDAVDLAETELVDLVWRHAGGGPRVNVVFVALLAIRERRDREGGTSLRDVDRTQKISEALVGRDDVKRDRVSDLLGQAPLVFGGDARGLLFCRDQKRVGVDDALTLDGELQIGRVSCRVQNV